MYGHLACHFGRKCISVAETMAQEPYDQLKKSYITRNPRSEKIYDRATQSMPGGNTRSVLFYDPFPLAISRAEGSKLYDVVR